MGGCCVGNCCVMNNPVGDFFRDIFGSGGSGGCGYHPGPSETEAHAKKIADELAEMKENIRKSSEKTEKDLIEYINSSMNSFIKELEDINKQKYGGISLNINIKGIRQKNDDLRKEVVGHIGSIMDERLVLTDKELSIILEERDDKKRAKNFEDFCKKIQRQSLLSLKSKIESTVKKQEEMVSTEIQSRLGEVEKRMQEAMGAYMGIVEEKQKDDASMEDIQIKYMFKYELCNNLLEQLES